MSDRITVHLCSRDRHSEIALCLQGLRTQSHQGWDLILLDDASGAPIQQSFFLMNLINRIKLENHKVKILRNNKSKGVCAARNKCIEEDDFNNPLTLRLDDDVIPEADYLDQLLIGINDGYDLVSGVTPLIGEPELKRKNKFVQPIINEVELNDKGELIKNGDDCGYDYLDSDQYGVLLPTHHFRSCALYKSMINKKVKYETNLTTVGFREEEFFSFRCIIAGYKLGVNTLAKVLHFRTPSGGVRNNNYSEDVQTDERTFHEFVKKQFIKHGDFISKYKTEVLKK